MNKSRYYWPGLLLVALLFGPWGCAYPISSQLRQQARQDLTIARVMADPAAYRGSLVIWGGVIQQTDNRTTGSTLTVLQYPLDWRGEPKVWAEPGGRFLIRNSGFLDPAIYRQGRRITVAGVIGGTRILPFDHTFYRYPELTPREIHLWPLYHYYEYNYDYYPYPSYWGGWGPYGGYYYEPYGYGPYFGPYGGLYGWWGRPYYGRHGEEWHEHGHDGREGGRRGR